MRSKRVEIVVTPGSGEGRALVTARRLRRRLAGRGREAVIREFDEIPKVSVEKHKVLQILVNLISNAIKYNRSNGSVIITGNFTDTEISIVVQDTGLGIPEDSLPHLFQKFYRVKEHEGKASGTGLGLSICKQIVQGHNGRIEVKSKMGIGTSFNIILPRSSRTLSRNDE